MRRLPCLSTPRALATALSLGLAAVALAACGPGDRPDVMDDTPALPDAPPDVVFNPDVPPRDVPPPMDATDAPPPMDVADAMDAADVAMDVPFERDAQPPWPDGGRPDGVMEDAPSAMVPLCMDHEVRQLMVPSSNVGDLHGASAFASASCQADTRGPEDVWLLRLGARAGVVLTTDSGFVPLDTVLSLRTRCMGTDAEVACSDDHGGRTTSRIRAVLGAGDYYVVVDEYGVSGTGGWYQLTATGFAPATNATCAGAVALLPAGLTGERLAGGGGAQAPCTTAAQGPQLYYRVLVPPSGMVTVAATPSAGGPFTPVLRAVADCAATSCLGSAVAPSAGAAAELLLRNSAATEATVLVSVASLEEDPGDVAFDLALRP